MGDIPHGWAAAELNLLLRDILFFECGEDDDPHIYLAPGVLPRWLGGDGGQQVSVAGAPTVFGAEFGYTLRLQEDAKRVVIDIPAPLPGVRYVYPCRFGAVTQVQADGVDLPAAVVGGEVALPAGTRHAEISYA